VIIDDFDVIGSSFSPHEAHAVLVIDPDTVLPLPHTMQSFEAIARRNG
jgi:hypothetical protein